MSESLPLTVGFKEEIIGNVFVDQARVNMLTDSLASGQFTFSSKFRQDTVTGELTLIELSLVPISTLSTTDFRLLNQDKSTKIFGVNSLFVDWNLNNVSKQTRMEVLHNRIKNLQVEFISKVEIEEHTKYRKDLLIDSIISLAIMATEYGITEKDVQQALEPQKAINPDNRPGVSVWAQIDIKEKDKK